MFRFNWYQNIEIRVILSIRTSPLKLNVRCSMKVNFESLLTIWSFLYQGKIIHTLLFHPTPTPLGLLLGQLE